MGYPCIFCHHPFRAYFVNAQLVIIFSRYLSKSIIRRALPQGVVQELSLKTHTTCIIHVFLVYFFINNTISSSTTIHHQDIQSTWWMGRKYFFINNHISDQLVVLYTQRFSRNMVHTTSSTIFNIHQLCKAERLTELKSKIPTQLLEMCVINNLWLFIGFTQIVGLIPLKLLFLIHRGSLARRNPN